MRLAVGWLVGTLVVLLLPAAIVAFALGAAVVGLVLLVAFFGGVAGLHLAVGIGTYRRVMRRPWPEVRPLEDDDDDW